MAQLNDDIKWVQITVRLGSVPSFEIHADEDDEGGVIGPGDAAFHNYGRGPGASPLLVQVLARIIDNYPLKQPIPLCIDTTMVGREIRQSTECQ